MKSKLFGSGDVDVPGLTSDLTVLKRLSSEGIKALADLVVVSYSEKALNDDAELRERLTKLAQTLAVDSADLARAADATTFLLGAAVVNDSVDNLVEDAVVVEAIAPGQAATLKALLSGVLSRIPK